MKMFAIVLMLALAAGCGGESGSCDVTEESSNFELGATYRVVYDCDDTGYYFSCHCPGEFCSCSCGEQGSDTATASFSLSSAIVGRSLGEISQLILGHKSCVALGIPSPY